MVEVQVERIGDYAILGLLGSGAMGAVYRARHVTSGAIVALKTLHADGEASLPAMRREVHALSALDHPGIVSIVEVGQSDGLPWYAMELIEGTTLRVRRGAPVDDVLALVRQLCAPLSYLHGEGLVHRDLKPANILLRADSGEPVLVDFGLSLRYRDNEGRDRLEWSHAGAGTLAYMSPEAIAGEQLDARADLYGLGCILYELLTGVPPFDDDTADAIIAGHLHRDPQPPSTHRDGLPTALDELVLGLLAKRRRERIGYAEDVAVCARRDGRR